MQVCYQKDTALQITGKHFFSAVLTRTRLDMVQYYIILPRSLAFVCFYMSTCFFNADETLGIRFEQLLYKTFDAVTTVLMRGCTFRYSDWFNRQIGMKPILL